MSHQITIKEIVNGIEITEIKDSLSLDSFISYNAKPFFRSTNEENVESFQIIDRIGEIYHLPALATEFTLIDINGNYWIPSNKEELIELSYKIRIFRPETEIDKVLNIGTIETTSNTVKVNIPSDGVPNSVMINGSVYENYYPSLFNFAAVVEFQKILIVYAKPDSTLFYLAQGNEALEAIEPDYDGLFIARLIVSTSGVVGEEERTDLKYINSDAWRSFTIVNSAPYTINMAGSLASSFRIKSTVANPKLGLVSQKLGRSFWDGSEFVIFNDSDNPLELTAETYTENDPYKYLTFEPYTIPPNKWVLLKVLEGVLVVAKLNEEIDNSTIGNIEGGSASSVYLITQQINGGNA